MQGSQLKTKIRELFKEREMARAPCHLLPSNIDMTSVMIEGEDHRLQGRDKDVGAK